MPACFQLFPIGSTEPARFSKIDDEMREHFGAPPSTTEYFRAWYDIEGFGCAVGRTWAEMREMMPDRAEIVDWLESHYTVDAWTEIGRRT